MSTPDQFSKFTPQSRFRGDLELRKKQIAEELPYFSARLMQAHELGNTAAVKKYLEKIIKLKNQQFAIEFKEDPTIMSPSEKAEIINEHIFSTMVLIEKFMGKN